MIIDTTTDELLINGQRWQRGGYLKATAYATEQINITARDGRVIGKALQWDAIYDQDKNLFGLNRDGVVTALTTVFNSRVKSPYNLEALRDVQGGTATYGDILIWSAPGEWQYDTLTQYHHAYNSEAATLRSGATATLELYYTAQADGDGISELSQSNTPASGYQIIRKLYYAEAAQADPDTGTWVQFADVAANTSFNDAKNTLLAYLKERTGGTVPISLKMTWEEVEIYNGLLDSYGGAAAAYSVRRLSSSYTGSLIQVERASDNTTQDIGYDSNGDLDTAAIATFCSGTTCTVRTWYDQSSNGNDAVQTTQANQPKIYDSSTGVELENALAALRFDGTNDGLNCATNLRTATGASTVITVMKIPRQVNLQNVFSFYKVQRQLIESTLGNNYDEIAISTNDTANELIKFTGADMSAHVLNFATWDGSSQLSSVDSVELSQNEVIQSQTVRTYTFGTTASGTNSIGYKHDTSSQYCDGTIQEVIVYLTDQSSNRSGIETNVNDYFGIYTPFTTGLLDDYGGAAAAYSLRRLSSTYTGSAIRVRRASDNAEQDIGFDIEGNLNTAALASFCSGTDGFVKTWYCQSGNGNDATQTTTANQPKIYDSSTGVMMNSAGTYPSLNVQSTIQGFDLPNLNLTEAHGFVVFEKYGISSAASGMLFQTASGNEHWGFTAGQIIAGFYSTGRPTVAPSGTVVVNTPLLMSMQSTANQVYHVNGSQTYNAAHTFANITAPRTYSNATFNGNYPELIIYGSDQSTNRTGIESNINTFYSIY